jgi:hypothetical protein
MNRPEFERALASLRERIGELPEPRRAELERLAEETALRHEEISRHSLQAHRAVERLELGFERLRVACDRLAKVAIEARERLERARALGAGPSPGVN